MQGKPCASSPVFWVIPTRRWVQTSSQAPRCCHSPTEPNSRQSHKPGGQTAGLVAMVSASPPRKTAITRGQTLKVIAHHRGEPRRTPSKTNPVAVRVSADEHPLSSSLRTLSPPVINPVKPVKRSPRSFAVVLITQSGSSKIRYCASDRTENLANHHRIRSPVNIRRPYR